MPKLKLSLACWDYDRTRALLDGQIQPDGIDLTCLNLPVEETFFRMLRHREFDIAEMSLSSYAISRLNEHPPFIAIPVFPSRFFRHSCIYVHRDSGIRKPQDLAGKRVGTPEFQMTAGVWIRGILSDEYGVPVSAPTYFTGGEESPGREEKIALSLPPEIKVQPIPSDKTLSLMLATGEIDALYTARKPSTYVNGDGPVERLFPDYDSVEWAYFQKTRIFPIMHTVVIRTEVYEKHRWVAQSLCKAFGAAQRKAYDDLAETAALKTMLPWLPRHLEDARQLMGEDFWPYGLQSNEHTLNTFLRYSQEQGLSKQRQGLSKRRLEARELFAPESLESFKI